MYGTHHERQLISSWQGCRARQGFGARTLAGPTSKTAWGIPQGKCQVHQIAMGYVVGLFFGWDGCTGCDTGRGRLFAH